MTLPANILSRIPGENPSGQNLRWEPVYDKVKEARREEDDLPQGEWTTQVKTADPALVIRLATEALCTKTKDLQLAAWLTEALILQNGHRNGLHGLQAGLELLHGIIEHFWDTLYPELEDGDLELRAAPLNWVGSSLGDQIRKIPLTQSYYNWFDYQGARAIPSEEASENSEPKRKARQAAIAEKKLTPEAFDQDLKLTPRDFYAALSDDLSKTLSALDALDELCTEKFKTDRPSFGKLRTALADVGSLISSALKAKGDPAPVPLPAPVDVALVEEPAALSQTVAASPERKPAISEEPSDRDDAVRRIVGALSYLRRMDPSDPQPYLALRGLRWAELLAKGSSGEFAPPSSETRQKLIALAREGNSSDLLDAVEAALASPCGAAWLDLQRYAIKACEEMGGSYDSAARAIRWALRALLVEIPDLPETAFLDGTNVANGETFTWLKENFSPEPPAAESDAPLEVLSVPLPAVLSSEAQTRDAEELAMRAARSGRIQEAMEILTREIALETSGRRRFERKTQLAQVCLAAGHESIAYPILKELAQEIESRKLAEWESAATLASPLTLLFRCMNKRGGDAQEKQAVYERICRLDPVQALTCQK